MARRVFFSFHFERDNWRIGKIRNCNVVTRYDSPPFYDAAKWETVKRQGDSAIKKWIDSQMHNTSVTVVLIGSETAERRWVQYEIEQSVSRGNGLLGVRIHNVKDRLGMVDWPGPNPLDKYKETFEVFGTTFTSPEPKYETYDWVRDNGPINIGIWIEAAAKKAGR